MVLDKECNVEKTSVDLIDNNKKKNHDDGVVVVKSLKSAGIGMKKVPRTISSSTTSTTIMTSSDEEGGEEEEDVLPFEYELFVPGRICLFGEHSDWAGGYRTINPHLEVGQCILSGTNQGLYARIRKSNCNSSLIILSSQLPNGQVYQVQYDASTDLQIMKRHAIEGDSFFSYTLGVYIAMREQQQCFGNKLANHGFCIDNYQTTLPVKKGLSSSAAISVMTVRSLNLLFDLNLTLQDEMEWAYRGEIMTPSKCGRMDQGGCVYGGGTIRQCHLPDTTTTTSTDTNVIKDTTQNNKDQGRHPILMTFDGDNASVTQTIHVPKTLHLILVDLCASKNTPAILHDLQQCFPFIKDNDSDEEKVTIARNLQNLLGCDNHVMIQRAVDALSRGCAKTLGECMMEAQNAFDACARPASPQHLTSPVLHALLRDERLKPYIYGGKGVGSQGDGSAQLVAKSHEDQQAAMDIITNELQMTCLPLELGPPGAAF